jgi:hypothetical protein
MCDLLLCRLCFMCVLLYVWVGLWLLLYGVLSGLVTVGRSLVGDRALVLLGVWPPCPVLSPRR